MLFFQTGLSHSKLLSVLMQRGTQVISATFPFLLQFHWKHILHLYEDLVLDLLRRKTGLPTTMGKFHESSSA